MRSIQRELMARGFAPGYADGVWGTHTRAAFEDFERERDLAADGLPDPEALRALFGRTPEVQRVRGVEDIAPARETPGGSMAATLALGALGGLVLAALLAQIGRLRPSD